jgi:hypothetical protein
MTASASSSCPGRPPSKTSSAARLRVARGDGGVDWSFGRKRGLGLYHLKKGPPQCPRPKSSGADPVVFLIVLLTTWARRNMSPGVSAFRHSSGALVPLLADLLSGLLLVVVFLRRLCAEIFVEGGISRRRAASSPSPSPSACRSGAPAKQARDLRLGPLGRKDEVKAAGLLGPDGVVLGR